MANSTTNLDTLSAGQAAKEAAVNALADAGSPVTFGGRRASTSSGLTWGYYGGRFLKADGTRTDIANGTIALTGSATNYIEVDHAGAISKNTSAFTAGRKPLYTVVTGVSSVTSYTDERTGDQGFFVGATLVVTKTYAASLTADMNEGADVVRVTLTGNITLTLSNGRDGQTISLELTQDGTGSRTFTAGAGMRFSTDIPSPTLTTTGNKMDRLLFQKTGSNYDLVAIVKGY